MFLLFCLAILTGAATPIQTAANSKLRFQLGSPFLASLINCSVGVSCLILANLITGNFSLPQDVFSTTPLWTWSGGLMGVFILVIAIVLMNHLGGLKTVLITMTGMVLTGLVLDHFALLNVPHHPFDLNRAIGLCCVILGIILVFKLPQLIKNGQKFNFKLSEICLYPLGLFSGSLMTLQSAINAILSVKLNSLILTALFCMSLSLILFFCISFCTKPGLKPLLQLKVKGQYWILCGGACGAFFILGNAFLIPLLGASAVSILCITGQLSCGLIIDHFGLLSAKQRRAQFSQILGLIIILLGIIFIRLL